MNAKVGIVTRTKNRTFFLERAIRSVLDQTFQNWHMVIVNDGGEREEVDALLARYRDDFAGRAAVLHNPDPPGPEAASNHGVRHCQTDYILLHDDDDRLYPAFLEKTVAFLESPEGRRYKGVATKITKVMERVVGRTITVERVQSYRPDIQAIELAGMSSINLVGAPIAFLYHKSVHDEVGYYDESLALLGDWEFNLRFLEKFDIYLLPEELAYYHIREGAVSADHANNIVAGADRIALWRTLIKNRLVRKDLESGRFGLGALLSTRAVGESPAIIARSIDFITKQLTINDHQDVVLYGTGSYAAQLYHRLQQNGLRVACVVDSDRRKWESGHMFLDLPIRSLAHALDQGHRVFVVGSFTAADAIVAAIKTACAARGVSAHVVAP